MARFSLPNQGTQSPQAPTSMRGTAPSSPRFSAVGGGNTPISRFSAAQGSGGISTSPGAFSGGPASTFSGGVGLPAGTISAFGGGLGPFGGNLGMTSATTGPVMGSIQAGLTNQGAMQAPQAQGLIGLGRGLLGVTPYGRFANMAISGIDAMGQTALNATISNALNSAGIGTQGATPTSTNPGIASALASLTGQSAIGLGVPGWGNVPTISLLGLPSLTPYGYGTVPTNPMANTATQLAGFLGYAPVIGSLFGAGANAAKALGSQNTQSTLSPQAEMSLLSALAQAAPYGTYADLDPQSVMAAAAAIQGLPALTAYAQALDTAYGSGHLSSQGSVDTNPFAASLNPFSSAFGYGISPAMNFGFGPQFGISGAATGIAPPGSTNFGAGAGDSGTGGTPGGGPGGGGTGEAP